MSYRGRFAPSPTGRLHFGSLVAAVASHARARSLGGTWLVRMEDLDPPREVPGAARSIIEDLAAFGMVSDEPEMFQSERAAAYRHHLDDLLKRGLAFPCACSRSEMPDTGIYPGTCREGLPPGGQPRSIRARVDGAVIEFMDQVQGAQRQNLSLEVGDFVIRRADGLTAYQLAVVVDDAEQGITEVLRGCDLVDSTPRQIHLQQMLRFRTPAYAHVPIAVDDQGRKLSKQDQDQPVDPSQPVLGLQAAWAFLGQPSPPVSAGRRVDAFWHWAAEAWSMDRIPTVVQRAMGRQKEPGTGPG